MAPGTAEEPLSIIDQHLLYIGPVPARTGRPNGYRNRSNEVRNRLSPRHHSAEKQLAIRTQIIKLLELGVIKELQASTYMRRSMAIDPRHALLNAMTQVPDGWLISNILETITRLGTMKPTCFGLLDFTAGYHQTPLDPVLRVLIAFRAAGGQYQWTRVTM